MKIIKKKRPAQALALGGLFVLKFIPCLLEEQIVDLVAKHLLGFFWCPGNT